MSWWKRIFALVMSLGFLGCGRSLEIRRSLEGDWVSACVRVDAAGGTWFERQRYEIRKDRFSLRADRFADGDCTAALRTALVDGTFSKDPHELIFTVATIKVAFHSAEEIGDANTRQAAGKNNWVIHGYQDVTGAGVYFAKGDSAEADFSLDGNELKIQSWSSEPGVKGAMSQPGALLSFQAE